LHKRVNKREEGKTEGIKWRGVGPSRVELQRKHTRGLGGEKKAEKKACLRKMKWMPKTEKSIRGGWVGEMTHPTTLERKDNFWNLN